MKQGENIIDEPSLAISAANVAGPSRETIYAALSEGFGYGELRPGQTEVIEALLSGQNVLAVMPTGSGKSLCYQLPALVVDGLTVVVSPLLALMRDQVAALTANGIPAATINSDQSRADNITTWRAAQNRDIRLLYLSPERLMTGEMLAALGKLNVSLIAVDEAHCISQWGPAFRPEYAALADLRRHFPDTPILGATATADPTTRADIEDVLFGGNALTVATGFDRPNLELSVTLKDRWKKQVVDFVATHKGDSGIVYCLSRRKTEEVAEMLRAEGHAAIAFHAGMDSAVKEQAQNRFMTEPGIIVVATIAFGMGIDKADIRYVLHTDLPGSPEAYYQEIGRAGRDGKPAVTMMLYGLDDIRMRRLFVEQAESSSEHKRREHKRLDSLIAYCEAAECRRRMLMRYFGEEIDACGNCDVCLNPVETLDGMTEARMVLSAIHRTGNRFGAAHIVNVLRGSKNEKIIQFNHDALPTFGVGAERAQREWHSIIRQMVAAGLLDIDVAGYGGLLATSAGAELMQGAGDFRYRPDLGGKSSGKTTGSRKVADQIASELEPATAELLQDLKALRLSIAKERGIPAYAVFSDRSLIDMASRTPRTPDAFADVFGVGEAKLRDFSAIFLEAIEAHLD